LTRVPGFTVCKSTEGYRESHRHRWLRFRRPSGSQRHVVIKSEFT